jgi:hypothetical protein
LIDELAAVVAVPVVQREGQASSQDLEPAGHALLMHPRERLQFGPRRRNVDRDESRAVPAGGGLTAMQHEIALQGAGADAAPFAPHPDGHLLADRRQGGGDAPRDGRPPPAQRAEQAIQGRGTRAQQGRADGLGDDEGVVCLQGREQCGQDGREQLAGEIIARFPDALQDGQAVAGEARGAPGAPARGLRGTAQAPDRGLTMTPRRATVLIQNPAALTLVGQSVPRAQHLGIFATSSLGHSASFPVSWVTPVLRHRLHFR